MTESASSERPTPRKTGRPPHEIVDRAYREIRHKILQEVYSPGQRLSENSLCRQYSLSRTPVRQILQRLANDGLVVIRPKSGTYVQQETSKEFYDRLQVRSYLERLAFRLAVDRATDKELEELEEICVEMNRRMEDKSIDRQSFDRRRFGELHSAFHEFIVELSKNQTLIDSYRRLNLRASHMFREMDDRESIKQTLLEHGRIVKLLKNRDRAGEDLMAEHLWPKLADPTSHTS